MGEKRKQTVYAFIDASNIWDAQKAKGKFLDFEKLKKYIEEKYSTKSVRVYYYAAYPAEGTRSYSIDSKHKFFVYLKRGLGFIVRKKPLKRIKISSEIGEGVEEKGDMDVELTIDAVNQVSRYDTALLFTGDSDYMALVRFIRSRDKKVFVYSSKNNISRELRTGADGYTDLLRMDHDIWRSEVKRRVQR
jgi:uncharacterized LabA/DUF88 family protein